MFTSWLSRFDVCRPYGKRLLAYAPIAKMGYCHVAAGLDDVAMEELDMYRSGSVSAFGAGVCRTLISWYVDPGPKKRLGDRYMNQARGARRKIVVMPLVLEEGIMRLAQQRGETWSATLRLLARERLEQLNERVVARNHRD